MAEAATALVAGWSAGNAAPPDGLTFVAVRMHAENHASVRRLVGGFRFLVSGSNGVLRGSPDLAIPQPAESMLESGQIVDGWIVFLGDGDSRPVLWYADALSRVDWRDAAFALHDESIVPDIQPVDVSAIVAGLTPDAPATAGQSVLAGDWVVTLDEVIEGQAVADRGGAGLKAFVRSQPKAVPGFLAARLTIENASDRPALFPPSAVQIADATGDPWVHILALTPPAPDVSAVLLPGVSFDGWVAFQRAAYNDDGIVDAPAALLRVLPLPLVDEARWIAVEAATTPTASPAATRVPESEGEDWAEGDTAIIADDRVNLRADASRTATVVAELSKGTHVAITGNAVEADGDSWVPVTVEASGQHGYVAAAYLSVEP